jgi:hypothetical protein
MVDKIIPVENRTGRVLTWFSLSLLFIISAAYLFLYGNGIFFYQENKLLFIFSGEYIQKFIAKPGGLLIYAGNFLTQGYFNNLYGSFLLSTLLVIISFVLIKVSKRLAAGRSFAFLFILLPACMLMLLQTRYDFSVHKNIGFLFVLYWFLISIEPKKIYLRFIFLITFPVFFYLVGSFAIIYVGMYIMFCFVYEKGRPRFYLLASLIIISFLTFLLFKEVLFLQPDDRLLGYPLFLNDSLQLTMYLFFLSGFFILSPLLIKASGYVRVTKKIDGLIPLATILIIFPVSVFILFKNYDPVLASIMRFEKSVYKQDWDAVIKQQEKIPSTNIFGQYYYNLALSEKGLLCDRLFFIRQKYGPMSLTLPRDSEQAYRAVYFYYTIGLISEAHHLAYELMVQHGYTPENLKLLIKTELIDGNFKIAERYVNVLKKTLHYKTWAGKHEKMLLNHDLVNSDPELSGKIKLLPKRDFFIVPDDSKNVELFLKENPDNKRAFEYKMARLMLEKDMLAVVAEARNMKSIGYINIPRHIEEVIVAYKNISKESLDLGGLQVRPETEQRFLQYRLAYKSYNGDKAILEKKLNKAEKNTFWFYLQFGTVNSDFLESNPENNSIY